MNRALAFIGAGRWAVALASVLARRFTEVLLYDSNPAATNRIRAGHPHPDLPATFQLPGNVQVVGSAADACANAEFIVLAVPSSAVETAAQMIADVIHETSIVVSVTKGLRPETGERISTVLTRILRRDIVILAGPGIPYDFVRGDPTSLVCAAQVPDPANAVRDTFTVGNLRVYSHSDTVGVEVAAAMKNVIAIAAGIADGLGLGINAKSALLARGLAEMIRFGRFCGAEPSTFAGLAGVGDLVVTAFSPHSRNYSLGHAIGAGTPPERAVVHLAGVAEGAVTAATIVRQAALATIDLPITREVNEILQSRSTPAEALNRLLKRPPKRED